jgi:hypothetical protein
MIESMKKRKNKQHKHTTHHKNPNEVTEMVLKKRRSPEEER